MKPYVNMVQKRCCVLWAKAHLKWTVSKWKVFWSDESEYDILVVNHGCSAKEEGDILACHQHSVKKPASLMGWGCIRAYSMGSLDVLEGTMNAERYIKDLEQHMLPSRWRLFQGRPCVFQQDNAKPHTAAIRTAWLCSRRVRVLNWSRSFTYRNSSETHNLDAQMSSNCFEKKRRCYTMVNMPPSQLFWDL